MHEYVWSRRYVIWGLPVATGIKYYSAIVERTTGKSVLEEAFREKLMKALTKNQDRINEELGLRKD